MLKNLKKFSFFLKKEKIPTKFFLSYKFTDVPIKQLHEEIDPIREIFHKNKCDFFSSLLRSFTRLQIKR